MKETETKAKRVLPGDKVAISEEFLPGKNTYDDAGLIRALAVGSVQKDMKSMEISVKPVVEASMLRVGDWVTGQVEVAQSNSAGLKIYYVNGGRMDKDFSGTLSLRSFGGGRGVRREPPVKFGDIVRCRVFSLVNGIIHLSIDEEDMGVIHASCGNCGKPLLTGGRDRVKCDECGNVEVRKLAADFGTTPIRP
ncbi:MAG: exosome complex RNA-binding protein Csl4 [Nitrososphaerales archaeon]|jgi:exosome complex component CSL4